MKRFCLLFCVFSWFAINSFASVTGSIGGTVTDATGGVIPGATITAINAETGVKVTTKSNATGAYNFPELSVGHYDLLVEATGFAVLQEKGIMLDVNAALRVDAVMKVTTVSERVEVAANSVQVDTVSTQLLTFA